MKELPLFYGFCQEAISNSATIYSNLYQYIFIDEENNTVNLIDFRNKKKISIPNICPKAHNYEYCNGIFLFISENELAIFDSLNMKNIKIKPEKSYIFLRAAFLNGSSFVVLSNYQDKNKLTIYSIS